MFIGTVIECIAFLSKLKGGIFEIREHKPKRSLSQNAFYWQCLEQISKAIYQPKDYIHNLLLREMGICEMIDNQPVLMVLRDTDEAELWAEYTPDYHLKPTLERQGGFRWYKVLKGSSKYEIDEMNRLIELALAEIREQGLTLPMDKATQKALEEYEKIKERRQQSETSR